MYKSFVPARLFPYIPASLLDEQEYCEMKLHYNILKDENITPKAPGEARKAMEALYRERSHRFAGESGFKRISVIGEIEGLPFAASPDAALVKDGKVLALIRGRIRRNLSIYDSDFTLLLIAALLVDSNGRASDDMKLVVAVAVTPADLREVAKKIKSEGVKSMLITDGRSAIGKVEVRIYDREAALTRIMPLLEYWKGERPPRAMPSPAKCSVCNYATECEYARLPLKK